MRVILIPCWRNMIRRSSCSTCRRRTGVCAASTNTGMPGRRSSTGSAKARSSRSSNSTYRGRRRRLRVGAAAVREARGVRSQPRQPTAIDDRAAQASTAAGGSPTSTIRSARPTSAARRRRHWLAWRIPSAFGVHAKPHCRGAPSSSLLGSGSWPRLLMRRARSGPASSRWCGYAAAKTGHELAAQQCGARPSATCTCSPPTVRRAPASSTVLDGPKPRIRPCRSRRATHGTATNGCTSTTGSGTAIMGQGVREGSGAPAHSVAWYAPHADGRLRGNLAHRHRRRTVRRLRRDGRRRSPSSDDPR